jgi:hypothetical protein
MNRLKGILTVLVVLGAVLAATRAREPKKDRLMQRKLEHSQKVLEGIALADYKLIEKNAEELLEVSKQAGFKVLNTPGYEMHGNEFRRQAEALIKNAKDKNIDGAALTYVELTLTCVKCHKHVREVRMTSLD